MKPILIFAYLFAINSVIFSQIIEKPNYSSASHPMVVQRVEFSQNQTIITISLQNQSESGYFCADKNIYLVDALSGKKYKLINAKDIPVCPETYYFKAKGEVLEFQLFFPKMEGIPKYINIIEDCRTNCFCIKGVVLDKDFNKEIDLGFNNYSSGNMDLALSVFEHTLKSYPDYQFGMLYSNIIQILAEKNDIPKAKGWFKILSKSGFQDKNEVVNRLKQFDYYSKLIF